MDGIAQGLAGPVEETAPEAPAEQPVRSARDAAFAALVDRHARFLYRVAFGLLRNAQDAEDAVQETFLKLYRNEGWLAMDDEKAFLARAVWRSGLDRLGSAGAKAMRHAEDVSGMEIASAAATPEENALGASARAVMKALIEALPETLRQPLVLSAVEGMRSHEVAAVLGIPEGTVRTRVMRAKAELRRRFLAGQATMQGVRP
jgi:RNA polymerase sigma-70 factor (ECF subfamily)